MDFALTPAAEQFRVEVRQFFAEFLTDENRQQLHVDGSPSYDRFRRAVAEKGWLSAGWPIEYGGQGRDDLQLNVLADEGVMADAPMESFSGSLFAANLLLSAGNEKQKADILPRVLNGDVRICLGYSEPDAGSDVASVKTRAVRDGDGWIIDGQKMFTSHAEHSQYVFLLVRTNPDVPKHKGLTTFLIPTDLPGIEIYPLSSLAKPTTTTYYRDVHVSDECRVGEVDNGWSVMHLALNLEHGGGSNTVRSMSAMSTRLLSVVLERVRGQRTAQGGHLIDDPSVRERLARVAVENEVSRLLSLRTVWHSIQARESVTDGPIAKVFSRESFQRAALDLMDLLGPEGMLDESDPDSPSNGWVRWAMLHSIGGTIYGGTSEIQRSIIAERGLGLPKTRRAAERK